MTAPKAAAYEPFSEPLGYQPVEFLDIPPMHESLLDAPAAPEPGGAWLTRRERGDMAQSARE